MTMDTSKFKILLVDDEKDILEFLGYNLEREGFQVYKAGNGVEAVKVAEDIIPQLIIMDVMMPKMDGIEACEQIRKNPKLKDVLIAFLTARGEDYSQIAGFDAGGDDYINKPIKPKILVSRVKALLKRYNDSFKNAVDLKTSDTDFVIDKERYLVIVKGEKLILPKKEFELLNLLYSKPEKVFTREDIFRLIWGDNIIVGDRTIDVHIRKLREKLGDNYITTIKGVGYKFES
jgi:two-component system alkaline phosphatase synthesis response regulator PhoP